VKEDKYNECSICRRKEWYKNEKKTSSLMNVLILKNKQKEVSLDDNDDTIPDTVIQINAGDNTDNVKNCVNAKNCIIFNLFGGIGWWLLFGICKLEINVANDYKFLCQFLMSLACGVALLLATWILIKSIYKLYSKIKENENINCCNFIVVIIFVIVTTLLGYITAFKLCELKEKFIEKNSLNNLILLIIAFLSGVAMWVILFLIIQIHKLLYKCCNMICGNECTEYCCNPIFILCVGVVSTLFTYLGWLLTFDLCGLKLNVNEEHNIILTIIISYFVGNSVILVAAGCMRLNLLFTYTINRLP
tara:strand:+ start:810 stop:1721 length:912 start_codon:yes stop_codon:yes gene_type:complete